MYTGGRHEGTMFLKFIFTIFPAVVIGFFIDYVARTNYNTTLWQIIVDFLKNMGLS